MSPTVAVGAPATHRVWIGRQTMGIGIWGSMLWGSEPRTYYSRRSKRVVICARWCSVVPGRGTARGHPRGRRAPGLRARGACARCRVGLVAGRCCGRAGQPTFTQAPGSPFKLAGGAARPPSVAFGANDHGEYFLAVTNFGRVSMFSVDRRTGKLAKVPGSPLEYSDARSVAFSPRARYSRPPTRIEAQYRFSRWIRRPAS